MKRVFTHHKGILMSRPGCFILALCLIFFTSSCAADKKGLTFLQNVPDKPVILRVYHTDSSGIYDEIFLEFERQTDIWIENIGPAPGQSPLAEEVLTRHKPDLILAENVEMLLPYLDAFAENTSAILDEIPPTFLPDEKNWTPISLRTPVILYNTKVSEQRHLPQSWEDLVADTYKGKLCIADPVLAGGTESGLYPMVRAMEDARTDTEHWLSLWKKNTENHRVSGAYEVLTDVANASCPLGISYEDWAKWASKNHMDIAYVSPSDDFFCYEFAAAALLRDSSHPDEAGLFLDFLLSPSCQNYLQDSLCRQSVLKNKVSDDLLRHFSYLPAQNPDLTQEWIKQWTELP
mgnify:CR=1 FL=1